jgi:2-oxoglutarate dehydrogenase E2 component (dihydrolipoamide succinyltransferase)
MTFSVTMPALGESVSEGTVTRWLKAEGDHIAVDEPLLEVSTDKVDTEIPSPVAGVLQKIIVGVDQTVPVGAELAVIADSAGASAPAPAAAAPTPPPAPAAPVVVETPAPVAPPVVETPAPVAVAAPAASAGTVITMPALGESVSEGTVTRWLKGVGDAIAVDEALLEVSTDKVDTEIPSPVAGTILAIDVPVDTTVPVGARLALIGAAGGAVASAPAPAAPAPVVAAPVTPSPAPVAAPVVAAPVTPPPAPVIAAPAAPLSQPADAYVTPIVR